MNTVTGVLRLRDLQARVRLSRSSIYARLDASSRYFDPTFPRPFPLGARAVGWLMEEVDRWIASRAQTRATVGSSA